MTEQENFPALRTESSPVGAPPESDAAAIVRRGQEWATALVGVMETQKMYALISGKKYPEVEAWQMILSFAGYSTTPRSVVPVLDEDGKVTAYAATIDLIDAEGRVRGGGYATCSLDSFPTKGRTGYDKDRAAQSTAQTWAISKAARNKFAFVVKLAGMEGTPADEIRDGNGQAPAPTNVDPAMLCPIHNVEWFKKGKMRQLAHPQGTGWCNRDSVIAAQQAISTESRVVDDREGSNSAQGDPEEGQPAFPDDANNNA